MNHYAKRRQRAAQFRSGFYDGSRLLHLAGMAYHASATFAENPGPAALRQMRKALEEVRSVEFECRLRTSASPHFRMAEKIRLAVTQQALREAAVELEADINAVLAADPTLEVSTT